MSLGYYSSPYMSRFANDALLGGGVRVRVLIREQRKIKRRSKALLSLCWQSWTSLIIRGQHLIKEIWFTIYMCGSPR